MSKPKPVPIDYVSQLSERITDLRGRVAAGKSPLPERIAELDEAVTEYAVMQAEQYEGDRAKAVAAGRSPNTVPPALRNHTLLDRAADLLMYEYLSWDHHDKMNVVDDPILSDRQTRLRRERETTLADVYTGGVTDISTGRKRGSGGTKHRVYDYMTPERDMALVPSKYLDLYNALDNAGLTGRQRQAIELVYFDGLAAAGRAAEMGVSKPAVNQFIKAGIANIKRYLSEHT